MAHHQPAPVDPQQLEHARHLWHNFTQGLKISGVSIAIILAVMAFAFVDW